MSAFEQTSGKEERTSGTQSPEDRLADLRHRLRTPLNHIIGYSDLLLEDAEVDSKAQLKIIRENASLILAQVQQWLSPGGELPAGDKIARLRSEIAGPLYIVIGHVGSLTQRLRGSTLLDLLRINVASMDLLSFTQGYNMMGKPRVSLPRTRDLLPGTVGEIPSRLLVVDDDEANCDVLTRQLLRYGHYVKSVENGRSALEALQEQPFDLVLLDVMMPGMTGFEVLQDVKANPELAGMPVIMMSAQDELELAAHCIQMGAEDYLLKPFDPVLLRARLHSALERERLHEAEKERAAELEQASLNLKRANDELHRFAFAASHDLQEPLRTVTTTLQFLTLQFEEGAAPEQRELMGLAMDASQRMSHLISDLLDYSLASSEERVPESVDAEASLRDALTNLRRAIEESGTTIIHTPLPPVLFNRAQLTQIFQNLIANAIKYRSQRPPEIRVGVTRQGNWWIFSIRDNGIGIEDKYLKTIFEPFRRLHGRNLPGTGLGLAISERIVEGFGGRIWAESTPGEGSAFMFSVRGASEHVTTGGLVPA